ncbi:MFS transporter [Paenibacillus sp. 19GGS1-52]|uniref:MFS transporter n=1 Tax=Paenibacillus sp. 19GGS1-52 TaxID=2758563 RepID=UPI001EFC23F0|nr:MFS transporter [Paenibacillus sp. 19GGS1-52]ULO07623.1 MFS transporter [Paenibacillus sp. 19GGS1-52]
MEHKKTNIRLTICGLLLSLILVALDQTIVSTAMPTLLQDFGRSDLVEGATVYIIYFIVVLAMMPLFGKLSEWFGYKRLFLWGLVLFIIGSALCGTAQSMNQLNLYRGLQAIGGGAVLPLVFLIIFNIVPTVKRRKLRGLLIILFGLTSALGPLVGTFLTDLLTWRWIFYINLPLGGLAYLWVLRSFHDEVAATNKLWKNWAGTVILIITSVTVVFWLEIIIVYVG